MITRRGWALAGSAAGLLVAGRILGLVQLAVLAIAAALTLLVASAWVRFREPRFGRRELKERLQVGVQGRVDIVVGATRPTATLSVNDAFDGGRHATALVARTDARGRRAARRTASPPIAADATRSDRCARRSPTRSHSSNEHASCSGPKR